MKISAIQTFILIVFLFLGCKKNNNTDVIVTPVVPQLGVDEVGISGVVLNGDGSAASGVSVIIDGKSIITNSAGLFEYNGTVTNTDNVILRISKQGYFNYSKTLVVEKNTTLGGLKFYLRPELVAGTFNSVNGGTVTTSDARLVFQANGVLKEDGSDYQGTVSVKMRSFGSDEYPGDARGFSAAGEKMAISFWASFGIGLYGQAGEKLKLSKPMSYGFNMGWRSIYVSGTTSAWAFNETEGNWSANGSAKLNGDFLEGTTTRLTYLGWGTAYRPALLKAYVRDKNLNPATDFVFRNVPEEFTGGEQASPINSKGICLIYIPAGRPGRTAIFSQCGNRIALLGVGSIEPLAIGNQTFQVDLDTYITSITGKLEDCSFAPLKGKAEFVFNNKKYKSEIKNGVYNFSFINCSNSLGSNGALTLYDEQNKEIYKNTSTFFSIGIKNSIPPISPCTLLQKGNVNITLDGVTHIFQAPQDIVKFENVFVNGVMTTVIHAESEVNKKSFFITYVGESGGSFPIYTLGFSSPGKNYLMTWGSSYSPGSVSVKKFKVANTLIEGDFNSKITLNYSLDSPEKVFQSTGTFSITY
ncbi:hypothetical protein ABIE26_001194 [Pedobacter africanus]|uniref:Uncharacterized protein n=1 Tax=Pedobacter africanus TaxID=151894 RepID=A0ACC6KT58_9SPHI|nr:hypothetical protein [Pedobacter africanus]MDR6782318.1 hypothetical protein [Pedobacter africanus]